MVKPISTVAVLVISLSLVSCMRMNRRSEDSAELSKRNTLKEMNALFQKRDFEGVLSMEESFFKGEEVVTHGPEAELILGRSYLEIGKCDSAIDKFDHAIIALKSNHSPIVAEAFFFKGICEENLGNVSKSVASFLDAKLRRNSLQEIIKRAVLPARLAAAYARAGNFAESKKYRIIADSEYARLRKVVKVEKSNDEWLYWMGGMGPLEYHSSNFEPAAEAFRGSQAYLRQVVDLESSPFAERAADDLISQYQRIWAAIESVPLDNNPEDKILALSRQQERQKEMAEVFLDLLLDVEKYNITDVTTPQTQRVSRVVSDYKEKATRIYYNRPVYEGLTEQAKKREGLKRDGRVVDPSGQLETKPWLDRKLPDKKAERDSKNKKDK
ncbi:MAG: hypothetical protein KDD25_04295 [Bdellovibrionales bacterium]|nr:hypothetical protein [Bdellovibrionales bacterium]